MNLLENIKIDDFTNFSRKHNARELIAAINIVKAVEKEGLNLRAVVRNLNEITEGSGAPLGDYPFASGVS